MRGSSYRFRPTERLWTLALLPVGAGVLDLGENLSIILLLISWPDSPPGQVATASLFTLSKGYAGSLSLALAVAPAPVAVVRRELRRA